MEKKPGAGLGVPNKTFHTAGASKSGRKPFRVTKGCACAAPGVKSVPFEVKCRKWADRVNWDHLAPLMAPPPPSPDVAARGANKSRVTPKLARSPQRGSCRTYAPAGAAAWDKKREKCAARVRVGLGGGVLLWEGSRRRMKGKKFSARTWPLGGDGF